MDGDSFCLAWSDPVLRGCGMVQQQLRPPARIMSLDRGIDPVMHRRGSRAEGTINTEGPEVPDTCNLSDPAS